MGDEITLAHEEDFSIVTDSLEKGANYRPEWLEVNEDERKRVIKGSPTVPQRPSHRYATCGRILFTAA